MQAYDIKLIEQFNNEQDSVRYQQAIDRFFNTKSEFEKDFYDQFEADLKKHQTKFKSWLKQH